MPLAAIYPLSPLGLVLNDISRAIEAKLYYPALLVALTIPEICSALTMDKKEFVKQQHYVTFVEKYVSLDDIGMSAIDCYRLRGGLVHRANLVGHPQVNWTNVVFSVPETSIAHHNIGIIDGSRVVLALSLEIFCNAMVVAANKWYVDNRDDVKMQSRMNDLIRWCPNGLLPFSGDSPVVASGS
jgi:hypothetical protein